MNGEKSTMILNSGNIDNNERKTIDNSTLGIGGGINFRNNAIFIMNGGSISYNKTNSSGAGFGASNSSVVTINGGLIDNNISEKRGGGIYFQSGVTFTMNGGTISNNQASEGGGIQIGTTYNHDDNFEGEYIYPFKINGGQIINNKATSGNGGGIYLAGPNHWGPGNTVIENALVINNKAGEYGGGLYNGPTGVLYLTEDDSSAFINNTADLAGDFFALQEREDRPRWQQYNLSSPQPDNSFSSIMLGKAIQEFHFDNPGDRYKEGDPAISPDALKSINENLFITNTYPNDALTLAQPLAKVIISGNEAAGSGGGIANNALLNFEKNDLVKTVNVDTIWDIKGDKPDSISISLVQINKFTNTKTVVATVQLNKANDYKYTFADLIGNYDYELTLSSNDKYEMSSAVSENGNDVNISITISDKPNPEKPNPGKPGTGEKSEPGTGEKPEPGIPDVVEPTNPLTPETEKPTTTPTPLKPGQSLPGTGSKAIVGSVMALVITSGLIVVRRVIK